ncbi:MobF family relaxase [Sulfurospirillum sp. 1612]|uniref:MobF family relaxase n=1 Tax=Sulfurospirillum sp. 1612 TaxID=3094835 RepID=UPI002F9505E0
MIATPAWIGANSAMEYHVESKDNYYQQEGDLGQWQGKGAESLGFVGVVTEKELEKALWGKSNEGNQVVGTRLDKDGDRKRAALDLTFNAPKSVSVALELANATGDKKLATAIMNAHHKAVEKGVDNFERLIQTRETIDGNTTKYRSGNIAVAKFTHSVARPVKNGETGKTTVDPSLHTHAVVMNMTQAKDGTFKAIETGDIFKEYIKVGSLYRMELANSMSELGFDIRIVNQSQAFFEIDFKTKDDDKLLEEFSKRSVQLNEESLIKELKQKYPNKSDSEIKQMAAYHSREWKGKIDRKAVEQDNLKRAEALGFDKGKHLQVNPGKNEILSRDDKIEKAKEYLENATYALSEETSVFSQNDIVTIAGKMAMREHIAPSVFEEALFTKNHTMISLGEDKYTTASILSAEHDLIESVKETKTIKQAYLKRDAKELVENYSNEQQDRTGKSLTIGQQKATVHILSNKNQVIGIQGDAGVGKTTMLKALNELKSSNTKIIGLSYTGKAANEIELKTAIKSKEVFKGAGIESSTIASFLNKYEKGYLELDGDKDLKIIVDEASMLGTKDAAKLVQIANETKAQLVFIGDEKQFKAIGAGDPFVLLKNHADMKTVNMNEVLRQKDQTLKSAVWALNQYDSAKAFGILDKKGIIQETKDGVDAVINEYFKDDEDKLAVVAGRESHKDNIILTNTNKVKDTINERIRSRLQDAGVVDQRSTRFTVKQSSNLTPSKKFLAESYEESSHVFLQAAIGDLKAGRELRITSVNTDKNTIQLDGEYEIDLKKYGKNIQAYFEKDINLSINEKIVFTKNDKKLGINNGENAVLKNIDSEGNLTFFIQDKKNELTFNIKDYNYLDYGYAVTTMKAQGQTAKNVIVYMDATNQNFNSFYVAITRAEENLMIFTNNKEQLKSFVEVEQLKYNATTYWDQLQKQDDDKISRSQKENKFNNVQEKSKESPTVSDGSYKKIEFANKISEQLNIEFNQDQQTVGHFIKDNLHSYNESIVNAPVSEKQLEFMYKIADTLYIDIPDHITKTTAKDFINEHISEFKDVMDDRHSFLLDINPDNLSLDNQEKYYNDLITDISKEKDFIKTFEKIQHYNNHNDVTMYEKLIQVDKLADTLNIKGMEIANRALENNFEKEYIEAYGLRDKPYEIAKFINNYTSKYEVEKEIAKFELVEEKANKMLYDGMEKAIEKEGLEISDEKVQKMLDVNSQILLSLQDGKEDYESYLEKEALKEEISEYLQEDNIYQASQLLNENKELIEEHEYNYFEEQLDAKMNILFDKEAKNIIKNNERQERFEREEMVELEESKENENNMGIENDGR